jgi:membrane protein
MMRWLHRLEDLLFQRSRTMPAPWGPVLRVLRFPAALLRDWLRGEINLRAMSLVYTTLLSLVPLMAFSFSILKGLGARDDLELLVYEFFRPMGSGATQLTARVMQFVENVRGGVLGSIGLAFLVWTVIATIQKVEESFNFIWRVERPRNLARRLSEYLSVLIVGPVLLGVIIGFFGAASSSRFALFLQNFLGLSRVLQFLANLAPYFVVTLVLSFMYAFVPNTRVRVYAALTGGIFAGVLWAVMGKIFATFIVFSSQMMAIYTGFAVVLTTLIWVYMNWLVLLIGAQLSFYVQHPQYLRHGQAQVVLTNGAVERVALSVMCLVARDYAQGKTYWTSNRLARELDVPGIALSPVLARLERKGLLLATEKEHLLPGKDISRIELIEILEAVRSTDPGRAIVAARATPVVDALMTRVENVVRGDLAGQTLKDLAAG